MNRCISAARKAALAVVFLFASLFAASETRATITVNQTASPSFSIGDHNGVTFANNTAGRTLVFVVAEYPITINVTSFTDDTGTIGTCTKRFGPVDTTTNNSFRFEVWSCAVQNNFASSNLVTVHLSAAADAVDLWGFEVSTDTGSITFGSGTSTPTPSATTGSTGSVSTTSSNAVLFAFAGASSVNPTSPGSPWSDAGQDTTGGSDCIYRTVTSSSSYSATFTGGSSEWMAGIVWFGDGGSGSPPPIAPDLTIIF